MSTRFILAITCLIAAVLLVPCVLAEDTSTANFTAIATSGTAPFEVKINLDGWSGPYQLDYGDKFDLLRDADKVNMVNFHRYKVPGTYTITLTLFGADGKPLLGEDGKPITVVKKNYITVTSATNPVGSQQRPLDARFTYTQSTGSANVGFMPLGNPYAGATSYYWVFGDGKFSNARYPNHIYAKPGTYTPQLTVGNEYGTATSIAVNGPTITIPDTGAVGNGRQADAFATIVPVNTAYGPQSYPLNTKWAQIQNSASALMAADWYTYHR